MSTYTDATVARIATSCARMTAAERTRVLTALLGAETASAPVAAPKVARAPKAPSKTAEQTKQDKRWAGMRGRKASIGQMERVNDAYEAEGLRTFATLASFRRVFDMEAASREYARMTGRYAG